MFKEFSYYLYEIHTGKESDNNKFLSAIIGIAFLQMLNMFSILAIIMYLFKLFISNNFILYLCIFIWLIINILDFLLIYRNRKNIIRKVESFTKKREKIGKTFFVFYILITLIATYYVMHNFSSINY